MNNYATNGKGRKSGCGQHSINHEGEIRHEQIESNRVATQIEIKSIVINQGVIR